MSTSDQAFDAERVAAFLLSLDQETAADLLALLEPGAMASVIDAMAKIDGALPQAKNLTSLYASLARDLHLRPSLRTIAEMLATGGAPREKSGGEDQQMAQGPTGRPPTERSSRKDRS